LRLDVEHSISFANGEPARLAGAGLYLVCFHNFRVVEEAPDRRVYSTVTTGYSYSLFDRRRRELIVYHFHPSGESWCTYPHLHAGTATGIISGKTHLATGHVALVAVVRMLIEDPTMPVTSLRPDWAHILDASQRAH